MRTASTVQNLLAQGDLRSEQVLRRAFEFWADVFELMHRLNRRFLPEDKEIRIAGSGEQGEDAEARAIIDKAIEAHGGVGKLSQFKAVSAKWVGKSEEGRRSPPRTRPFRSVTTRLSGVSASNGTPLGLIATSPSSREIPLALPNV